MAHENLQREERLEGSSDRAFGMVFTAFFAIIAMWPLLHGGAVRWWALAVAAVFAFAAALRPAVLSGLNRLWLKLGLLLGHVVSPIALGVFFFLVVSPLGFVMRLAGKDPLRLRRDPAAPTYWIEREPPGPPRDSMTNQF